MRENIFMHLAIEIMLGKYFALRIWASFNGFYSLNRLDQVYYVEQLFNGKIGFKYLTDK